MFRVVSRETVLYQEKNWKVIRKVIRFYQVERQVVKLVKKTEEGGEFIQTEEEFRDKKNSITSHTVASVVVLSRIKERKNTSCAKGICIKLQYCTARTPQKSSTICLCNSSLLRTYFSVSSHLSHIISAEHITNLQILFDD